MNELKATVSAVPSGEQPHEDRFTAPGSLEMLQCFANTHHVHTEGEDPEAEHSHEHLVDVAGLRDWLLEHCLISQRDRVTEQDHRDALALRDAFRALAYANHGEPTPRDALRALDRAADAAHLHPRFRDGETVLEPQVKGPAGALGRLVALAFRAMAQDSWKRLKICRDDTCAVVFYDYSKNQSRSWCSMDVCGNRNKVRNFRRREKTR